MIVPKLLKPEIYLHWNLLHLLDTVASNRKSKKHRLKVTVVVQIRSREFEKKKQPGIYSPSAITTRSIISSRCASVLAGLTSSASRSFSNLSGITISRSSVIKPSVKLNGSFLKPNLSICNASIRRGLILFRRTVSVSALEENVRSHGTDDAWIGK